MLEAFFENWRKRREARRDLQRLSAYDRYLLARDIGVPEDLLDRVLESEDRSAQLEKLLAAVGLDPQTLRRRYPDVFVDMVAVCAQCKTSRVCRRALARGDATARYGEFCPNAPTIESLSSDRKASPMQDNSSRERVH